MPPKWRLCGRHIYGMIVVNFIKQLAQKLSIQSVLQLNASMNDNKNCIWYSQMLFTLPNVIHNCRDT